jgi:phosphatidylglycerophosphatase C
MIDLDHTDHQSPSLQTGARSTTLSGLMTESTASGPAPKHDDSHRPGSHVRKGVAAFDFDGTLVRGDSLRPFLTAVLGRRQFPLTLVRSAPAMGLGYRAGGRDQAKAALLDRAVKGLDSTTVQLIGNRFGKDIAGRTRPDLAARLRWHRGRGHRTVLVSASLSVYLEPFARLTGFDDVIATRLEVGGDGRLTGHLDGSNVRGPEKARRLKALLGSDPVELWAYGDSAGDREMLAMADHPTWVDGRPLPSP